MIKYLLPLFAVLSLATAAELPPSMKFDARIGEIPSLLLLENLKPQQPGRTFSSNGWTPGKGSGGNLVAIPSSTKRYYSRMPVIVPDAKVGQNMPVKLPGPAIDYKLRIKDPDVELRK